MLRVVTAALEPLHLGSKEYFIPLPDPKKVRN
jgi:hypothetical protein